MVIKLYSLFVIDDYIASQSVFLTEKNSIRTGSFSICNSKVKGKTSGQIIRTIVEAI